MRFKVLSMAREFASKIFAAGLLACVCWAGVSYAAVLNVDLDVRTSVKENEPTYQQKKNVAIFILDRSDSMKDPPVKVSPADAGKYRNRNDQLVALVRERIQTLKETQKNTEVWFLPFSGSIGKMEGPFSLDKDSDYKNVLNWKGFPEENCKPLTLLWDTLAYALKRADEIAQKDKNIVVRFYAYTDGGNQTGGGEVTRLNENTGEYKYLEFPQVDALDPKETDRVVSAFYQKYGDKINQFVKDGIQWRWLGFGDAPKGIENIRKDQYKMQFSPNSCALKNPASAKEQTLKASLVIPIPNEDKKNLSGKKAKITLEINGDKIEDTVSLTESKKFSFQIPDKASSRKFKGKLSISSIPDISDRIELTEPDPLEIEFSAPDNLSFLSFEPKSDVYVKVGEEVNFSAKASDGASVIWNIGGKPFDTNAVSYAFEKADDFTATAVAKKAGFTDTSASVKVHVIETGVDVRVATSKPTVGEAVEFVAEAKGKPEAFYWEFDGAPISGKKGSLKVPGDKIQRSGSHSVKVQASYGNRISADSKELSFEVAAKPMLKIKEPYSGSEYGFGDRIECLAYVEGDLDKVVWSIDGPSAETMESSVDREGRVAKALFTPKKGGQYTLSAKANGPAGEIPATTEVKFKVAFEDLGIFITKPATQSTIKLGKGVTNPDLEASVKGEAIKQVKWTMLNTKTGKQSDIGKASVQNGVVTCACPNDESIGDGATLLIQAEALYDDSGSGEPIVSPKIELRTLLDTTFEIDAIVDGNPANGQEVSFGKQIKLVVTNCASCISKDSVEWFAENEDGKERSIGKRLSCMSEIEDAKGDKVRSVRYFARAKLPDGSDIESSKISVIYVCGCKGLVVSAKLTDKDGNIDNSFGLSENIKGQLSLTKNDASLTDVEAVLQDVVWNMGDGTTYKDTIVHHSYNDYSTNTITVTSKCKDCGQEYIASTKVKVVKQPAVAHFMICKSTSNDDAAGYWISQSSKIKLVSKCTGDTVGLRWTHNGELMPEYNNDPAPEYECSTIGKHEFSLIAVDPSGNESDPEKHSVRVYRLWLIVILIIAAIILCTIIWYYWSYDDPMFWKLRVYVDDESLDDTTAKRRIPSTKKSISKYWEIWNNRAVIPLHKLVGTISPENWGKKTDNGKAELVIYESRNAQPNGVVLDRQPRATLQNRPTSMGMTDIDGNGKTWKISSYGKDSLPTVIWMEIDTSKKWANKKHLWYRIGTTILIIGFVAIMIAVFAA